MKISNSVLLLVLGPLNPDPQFLTEDRFPPVFLELKLAPEFLVAEWKLMLDNMISNLSLWQKGEATATLFG